MVRGVREAGRWRGGMEEGGWRICGADENTRRTEPSQEADNAWSFLNYVARFTVQVAQKKCGTPRVWERARQNQSVADVLAVEGLGMRRPARGGAV